MVSRVRFSYNGLTHTEGTSPFAMAGKKGDSAFQAVPYLASPGPKTVTVEAFDAANNIVDYILLSFTVT